MDINEKITPFRIAITDDALTDLEGRLANTRLPQPLPGDDWSTGVPVDYLGELVDYWRTTYDWRAQEAALNEIPQFTTEIDGQTIHFLHVRSEEPGAVPLLLTHGWPGSVAEFVKVIGPLTDPRSHGGDASSAFHLVIPSIPGFGFSSPLVGSGWDTARIATAWIELMRRLGYVRFGTQGGDLGAGIAPEIARISPESCFGVHVNGSLGAPLHQVSDEERASLSQLELDRLSRIEAFMQEEFGYIAMQSTRPQLVGAALTDSPVGQLAWIFDKFREWTHPRTELPDTILDRDWLLTNVMLYWLTGTSGTSAYVGYAQESAWGEQARSSGVPTGAIMFAHDIGVRRYAEVEHNITRWTDVPDQGGHFAAIEVPDLLVADIREFFADLR